MSGLLQKNWFPHKLEESGAMVSAAVPTEAMTGVEMSNKR